MKKTLALFDFDGTITTKDTFLEFIRFYVGSVRYYFGFLVLSPALALMVFKVIPNWKGKQFVITWFFKGEAIDEFNRKGELFCKTKLPALLRPLALVSIGKYQSEGAKVLLVSASAENWLAPWCNSIGITYVATQLEVVNGKITGIIKGKNCYGAEKVSRIYQALNPSDFDVIHAFGDSSGDREMLALATSAHYKPFRS